VIRFSCEQCGHKIGVNDGHTGKRGKCPECSTVFIVPAESTVIDFNCANCGHGISSLKIRSGKKVICPKCKSTFIVPSGSEASVQSIRVVRFACSMCHREIEEPESSRGKLIECPHCKEYVPVPLEARPAQEPAVPNRAGTEADKSDQRFEELQSSIGQMPSKASDHVTERKLPWPLDVFLYPATISGMIHLAILSLLPPMLLPLGQLSYWVHPPIFGLGFVVIFVGYLLYCLSTCIRDSASGSRSAENIDVSLSVLLDVWELISPILLVFVCIAVCLGPLLAYFIIAKRTDFIFWFLVAYGAFSLPMALLAAVLFDSLRALNPALLAVSMLNVLPPYCSLVLLFCTIAGLIGLIMAALPQTQPSAYILSTVCIYSAMIAAHLLGRFYARHQEKLNWEV
jgi:DNA-directed RNA polymerase subunit RPC12/RpoP